MTKKKNFPAGPTTPGLNVALDLDLYDKPKEKALSVRINSDIYRALEKAGEDWGVSISDALRSVLAAFFAPEVIMGLLEEQVNISQQIEGLERSGEKMIGTRYLPAKRALNFLKSLTTYYEILLEAYTYCVNSAETLKERGELIIVATKQMQETLGEGIFDLEQLGIFDEYQDRDLDEHK